MRIGIRLAWMNGQGHANFIGDHALAEAWFKYLSRREDVTAVQLVGPNEPLLRPVDVMIHFHPDLPLQLGCKNLYYCQNIWPEPHFPGGTVGVFSQCKQRFAGYIFASETMREKCGADGAVIPFATDPELFYPDFDPAYAHNVAIVANARNHPNDEKYLGPATGHGLAIYGGLWPERWAPFYKGRATQEQVRKIYSSSKVLLNYSVPEAVNMGMVNSRVYDILACGGLCASDEHPAMKPFMARVWDMNGSNESLSRIQSLMGHEPRPIECYREWVIEHHTYAHRMETLMAYLKGVV